MPTKRTKRTEERQRTTSSFVDLVNFVGHPNRVVALKALRFERVAAEGDGAHGSACNVPLGDLPAVLLCECWNDFRQFAADGPGFDPEWEKKTET